MSALAVKVERLVALSSSSNDNEARNAALKACQLIREHKMVLLLPTDPRLGGRSVPPFDFEADLRERVRRAAEQAQRSAPPPPPPAPAPEMSQRRRITLKFDSFCSVCRNDLVAGQVGWWLKDKGCLCTPCHAAGRSA